MEKIKRFFKNEFVKLILIGVVINALCFVFGTCYAKASTQNNSLPYIPATDNNPITESEYNWIKSKILESYPGVDFSQPHFIFRTSEGAWYTWSEYLQCLTFTVYFPGSVSNTSQWVGANTINDFHLYDSSDYLDVTLTDSATKYVVQKRSDIPGNIGSLVQEYDATNNTIRFYGEHTPINIDNGYQQFTYYQYYPCYTNVSLYTNSPLLEVVNFLNPGKIAPAQPGEPTEPDYPNEPTPPVKPTIPTPPVKPTINDISDLGDYLGSLFQWLINTIGLWADYLGDLIKYAVETLAGILKSGFDSIYNNFKNFFQPYLDKFHEIFIDIRDFIENVKDTLQSLAETVEHFFKPFDFNQAQTQLNNSGAITSIRGIVANIKTFANVFSNTSEPDNLTFTLDFTQNSFFNFGLCSLDFNVIKPFRSAIRLIIGCLLVFGLIVTISTSINAYIGGNSSKNEG